MCVSDTAFQASPVSETHIWRRQTYCLWCKGTKWGWLSGRNTIADVHIPLLNGCLYTVGCNYNLLVGSCGSVWASVWSGVQVFNAERDLLLKFPAIMSQSSQPKRYKTQNRVKKFSQWYVFMRVFPKAKLCFVLVTQNSFLNYKKNTQRYDKHLSNLALHNPVFRK